MANTSIASSKLTSTGQSFKFSPCFKKHFEQMISLYQTSLDQLNSIVKSNNECEYGYCNKKYSVRLITPNDISTFAGNLVNAFDKGLLGYNINDVNAFSVASAKRFIDEHDDTPFEDSNMQGPLGFMYINPKTYTLADLLTVARNEIFPNGLISNYEIGIRCQNINDDLKRINDLHFSGVMKNIVNALPSSMNICCKNKPIFNDGSIIGELFTDAIETFIIFSITLNMITIESLKGYCYPSTTYSTKLKPGHAVEITQESVDTSSNSPVFIILSEGKTPVVSDIIKKKTKSAFSHAAISFDASLREMYSFADKRIYDMNTFKKQNKGFRVESIYSPDYMGKDINIGVYAIYVDNSKIQQMKEYLQSYKHAKTEFSWGTVMNKLFDIDKKSDRSKYHQICSSFVNTILKQADINMTDKNVPAPVDFANAFKSGDPNEVIDIFYGNSNDYDVKDANEKLMGFTKSTSSIPFGSAVTECCTMLRTNDMMIRSKIPFNCNMRTIVLQDMHPEFKDTMSALAYMMNNQRSPIAQLLVKYSTLTQNDDLSFAGGTIARMIFHIKDCDCSSDGGGWYSKKYSYTSYDNPYKKNDFHTDVNWLDKIAYGNPFYDGNYRRDAMGNNTTNSIVVILDNIYHMFDCDRLQDNHDLANHIIKVGNAMKDIINSYKHNELPNWEMVRDVLAVLGEILTRSMLKLYHNNTRTLVCTDAIEDTMVPGYMYMETFVMEADDTPTTSTTSNANTSNVTNNASSKPSVEVNRDNVSGAKAALQNLSMKISRIISRFVRYMHDVVAKYAPKFVDNHRLEIKWVEQNKELNTKIVAALDKDFVINVANFPDYVIKPDILDHVKVDETVKKYLDNDTLNIDPPTVFKEMLPQGCDINYGDDNSTNTTKVQNFVLYGNVNHTPSNTASVRVSGKQFETLCSDIVGAKDVLTKLMSIAKDISNACSELDKQNKAAQRDAGEEGSDTAKKANRINALFTIVNKLNSIYAVKVLETVVNKFYKNSYSVYRDIVQAYKQQQTDEQKEEELKQAQEEAKKQEEQKKAEEANKQEEQKAEEANKPEVQPTPMDQSQPKENQVAQQQTPQPAQPSAFVVNPSPAPQPQIQTATNAVNSAYGTTPSMFTMTGQSQPQTVQIVTPPQTSDVMMEELPTATPQTAPVAQPAQAAAPQPVQTPVAQPATNAPINSFNNVVRQKSGKNNARKK